MRRFTMKDVADQANVSIATVSRVLNQSKPVSKQAETNVREAIAALNYKINPAARTLSSEKSGIIGLIIDEDPNTACYSLVQDLEQEAFNQGYVTLLCIMNGDSEKEKAYLEKLYHHRVEGLLVLTAFIHQENEQYLKNAHIPTLFYNDLSFAESHQPLVNEVQQFFSRLSANYKDGCSID